MKSLRVTRLAVAVAPLVGVLLVVGSTGCRKVAASEPQTNCVTQAAEAAEKVRVKSVRELLEDLARPNTFADAEKVHAEAAQAIRERGTNVLPDLVRIVKQFGRSPSGPLLSASVGAKEALKILGPEAKPAIPSLIELLGNIQTRSEARLCVQAIGPEAVPPLMAALTNANQEVRAGILDALGMLGADAQASVPVLLKSLKDEDAGVRQSATTSLAAIGAAGQQLDVIVPALVPLLKDEKHYFTSQFAGEKTVLIPAAEALARIALAGHQPEPITAALVGLLEDNRPYVRAAAVVVMRHMPEQAKAIVPELLKTIQDTNAVVRFESARALAQFRGESDTVVPALLKALEHQDLVVRVTAADALIRLDSHRQAAERALVATCVELTRKPNPTELDWQCVLALPTLEQLDPKAAEKLRARYLEHTRRSSTPPPTNAEVGEAGFQALTAGKTPELAAQLNNLRLAILRGQAGQLKALLRKHPGLANGQDPFTPERQTPLTLAVQWYQREEHGPASARYRREHPGSWSWPDWMQWTTTGRHKQVVELLLANKADANAMNGIGVAPLHVAAGAYRGPSEDGTDMVPLLLAHKADVNVRDARGNTPLHVAARCSNLKVATLLLAHKADVNARNDQGLTPLAVVAGPKSGAIAQFLRAPGAKGVL